MRGLASSALIIFLGACYQSSPPREASERIVDGPLTGAEVDMMRKELPGMTALCVRKLRAFGINGLSNIPTDQCFEMTPSRRWTGLWRNQFEGSQFCPSPARECPDGADNIWLQFDEALPQSKMEPSGGLYAVDFVGRRTADKGLFGHMGMSEHEMIVDRVISISEVEAPPPPPTPEEELAYWMACLANHTCIPNAAGKARIRELEEATKN